MVEPIYKTGHLRQSFPHTRSRVGLRCRIGCRCRLLVAIVGGALRSRIVDGGLWGFIGYSASQQQFSKATLKLSRE